MNPEPVPASITDRPIEWGREVAARFVSLRYDRYLQISSLEMGHPNPAAL